MPRELIKGNEAVVKAAILAGCQAYFGYPITPASEIAEAAAKYFPLVGRTFIQAESEIASIQMVYGAAGGGVRVMTASSGPGISLKQEGVSYCAGAELPCVIADIMRGGPGLGNIAPEQSDYHQVVKGGGHGNYRCIVLAPNSAQEMCDLTIKAFDLADQYRTPVYVVTDGYIGQMMEQVNFPTAVQHPKRHDWGVHGDDATRKNLINSIYLDPEELEEHNRKLQKKYAEIERKEARVDEYRTRDAELLVIGYGIISRILRTTVDLAREQGIKVGLLRPVTLWPFPAKRIQKLCERVQTIQVVELSNGQMVDDVRLAVEGRKPVKFYGRMGGSVPSAQELLGVIRKL
ncbi:MAG TPA: 3-methyl-2-oxobutanoate dehydrogenase subunit VorB [Acidobacteriota bacterium]|nr:3-methyl-2-oxobutanoate dehydrogenase subunit VorB [Acidobacteriota bacterium]